MRPRSCPSTIATARCAHAPAICISSSPRTGFGSSRAKTRNVLIIVRPDPIRRGRRRKAGGLAEPEEFRRSEAEAIRDVLIRLGVPREVVIIEPLSSNTAEQAERVAALLRDHPRFALITTPIHMPRAVALFRSRGLNPLPAPSHLDYTNKAQGSMLRFVPSAGALRASELSMYEYLGMMYATSRGWLDPARDAPQ